MIHCIILFKIDGLYIFKFIIFNLNNEMILFQMEMIIFPRVMMIKNLRQLCQFSIFPQKKKLRHYIILSINYSLKYWLNAL